MSSTNFGSGHALRISLLTISLILVLISVNYGAGAGPNIIYLDNNSSSEAGITYTQDVPFARESIDDIIKRESKRTTPIPKEQRVVPFQKGPSPKELPSNAKPKRKAVPQETNSYPLVLSPNNSLSGLSDNNRVIPPDTMGAVGPSHLLETLNSEVGIFNKSTGALISSVSLQAFWSSLGTGIGQPANSPFDPKSIYDQNSGRFIVMTLGKTVSPQRSWLMIAVSQTSDPNGLWNKWAIDARQSSNNWADYPGLGADANNVYITANSISEEMLKN